MRKIALGSTQYFTFSTRAFATGVPTTIAGSPTIGVYEENNDTVITAADTLNVDVGSGPVVGLHEVAIAATSGNGFEYGKSYSLYMEAGTVGGVSVIGEKVGEFIIETATEEALRLLNEFLYPSATLAASGSHSTTVIDMTGVLDAQTKADGLKNEILAVHDATNDTVELVRCTGSTVTTLLATVEAIDDGGVMSFTPAVGDHVWRVGQYTSNMTHLVNGVVPTPNTAGVPDVNVQEWLDVVVTLSTGNKPDVNVDEWGDVLLATTNPLPNAVPGAAGGVFIAGTNAATVVTTSFTTTFTGDLTGSVGSVTGGLNTAGTITTLDALDTAQDTQHAATIADILDKVGAVGETAAAGDPSATESVIQYVKQIVNTLEGAAGVPVMLAAAAPANAVSIVEMVRAIYEDRTIAAASYFDPATDTVVNVTNVATLTGHTNQTADHTAGIADIPTVAEFDARTLVAASYFDPAADTVVNVTNVATLTGHTNQTADHTAAIAALAATLKGVVPVEGTIGATGNDTTHLHLTGLTYGDDELNGYGIVVFDNSLSEYHVTHITDWVLSTALATVPTLPFTPELSVDTYWLISAASIGSILSDKIALNVTAGVLDIVNLTNTVTTYTGNTLQTGDSFVKVDQMVFTTTNKVDVRVDNWAGTAVTIGNGAPDVNIASTDDIDLSATQKASVNTEVDTAIGTTTISEVSAGAPPTNPTLIQGLMYLYMMAVHRVDVDQGTAFKEYFNNAGTILWKKVISDDGTVYSEAESIAG